MFFVMRKSIIFFLLIMFSVNSLCFSAETNFSVKKEKVVEEKKTVNRKNAKKKKNKYVKPKGWLDHLMQISKARGDMEEELKEETESYSNVKKAIDQEKIKEGQSAQVIAKQFGAPSIKLVENDKIHKRWVYKKGGTSYFEGEKIYLFFDENNKLVGWENIPAKVKETEEE